MEKDFPLVSVIILNFNGEKYIENCFSSVLASDYQNFELILVDNASTDSSLSIVEKNFSDKRLRIFRSSQNLGFSGGNNLGYVQATGKYVVFLNNDTIVERKWLTNLVEAMEKDETIGLAGSLILNMDRNTIQTAGWLWSDYLLFLNAVGQGEDAASTRNPIFEVSFASGASMMARKQLVDEVGLFDPKIPFNYDDTLLSVKTWISGKRVVTVSNSIVYHICGASISKFCTNYFVIFSNLRAKICLMFDSYFYFKDLLKGLLALQLSLVIQSVNFMKTRNLNAFSASSNAFFWTLTNFKHVWKNRLELWSKATVSPNNLLKKFMRIKLRFPICVVPSKTSYLLYRSAYLKYENALVRKS